MDAAKEIGGAVQEKFGWTVKMKGFDIEVVANVDSEQVDQENQSKLLNICNLCNLQR